MLTAGVDLGGTKVFAALVDESGAIRARATRPTEPDAATGSVLRALAALLEASPEEPPSAVGVAAAAMVEHPSGRAMFSPNVTFENPDLPGAIRARFGLPALAVNDATAATWAEHQQGAGRGVADLLLLTVGTGIGGGAIVGGRLLLGDRGYAGEFGHLTVVDGGPLCACGQRGCLEAMASGTAIGRMAREGIGSAEDSIILELAGDVPQRITGALVAEAAHAGDEYAASILDRAGRWLGTGLASLVNVFDPALIVIGGGAAGAGWFLLEPARRELDQRVGDRRLAPPIVAATLGNDAGALGAASLARGHLAGSR